VSTTLTASREGSNNVKKQKLIKLSGIQAGIAGEYLVAAELTRRGYVASLTLRNTRDIDILASNSDATKSVGIQVKTNQGGNPDWRMHRKAEDQLAANLFYVLVCLVPELPATFYVVPSRSVADHVRTSHAKWLKTPGKRGQAHRDTDMRRFSDRKHQFKDRWDLLNLE
jgi:hypothetical protein